MRIVLSEFISLDGVVQAPGGVREDTDGGFAHGGWSMEFFDVDTVGPFMDATLSRADALLYGRRTWRNMAEAWPKRGGDPFADRINTLPKYVVSDSLTEADMFWNTTLVSRAQAQARIAELRAAPGGDLLLQGSPSLARELLGEGLIDELRLVVEPVILGGGKSIFPSGGVKHVYKLESSQTAKTGLVLNTYRLKTG